MLQNKNMEKFEIRGVWWLPSDDSIKVPGLLKYNSKDGGSLELFGTLFNGKQDDVIINGESTSSDKITLNRCILSNFTRTNKYQYTDYFAPEIFFNVHFTDPTQIKFSEMYCHFSNTQEWAQLAGFKSEQDIFENKLVLTQSLPTKRDIQIDDKVTMSFFLQVHNPVFKKEIFEDINITQRVFFSFIFTDEYSYDMIEEFYIRHLQHFLSLATSNPIYPIDLMGKTKHNTITEDGKEYNPLVKIFLHLGEFEKRVRKTRHFNMLFLLRDINDSIEMYLQNWFSNKELLQPTIGLFLGTLNNINLFTENRFLNLSNSLESYHRRKLNTKKYSEEEKDILLQTILANIDKKYEQDISEKLKYIDEVSLRRRIKDIYELAENILSKFYNRKDFAHQVTLVRNYYTHLDRKLKPEVDKIDIHRLMDNLEITLIICLLIEIGFSLDKIDEMLKRRPDYNLLTTLKS
ncbi:MAG: hypothetical protein FIA82_01770 [Melioribacter sp.]|nr:hypothetical protein [Melioribacter sp.]